MSILMEQRGKKYKPEPGKKKQEKESASTHPEGVILHHYCSMQNEDIPLYCDDPDTKAEFTLDEETSEWHIKARCPYCSASEEQTYSADRKAA